MVSRGITPIQELHFATLLVNDNDELQCYNYQAGRKSEQKQYILMESVWELPSEAQMALWGQHEATMETYTTLLTTALTSPASCVHPSLAACHRRHLSSHQTLWPPTIHMFHTHDMVLKTSSFNDNKLPVTGRGQSLSKCRGAGVINFCNLVKKNPNKASIFGIARNCIR